ncbi:hypothetical protein [Frankia sp. CcI49]|uniref:hypothetical protein n=1 Tax=Frankia sp. CcI49 TaxID=1745382 RepID=UPI0010561BD7|nr:hypothetical protein [Frankia sp. CcI49]
MSSRNGTVPPPTETYDTPPAGDPEGDTMDYGLQDPDVASVPPRGGEWKTRKAPKPERAEAPSEKKGEPKAKLTATEKLWRVAVVALAAVIIAPTALSGAHLIKWAGEPIHGLDLDTWLVWLPLLALDGTAIVGITMVTIAALRGEHGGAFHLVSWSIALISAGINYGFGTSTTAEWDEWFFPVMSLTGPALLEITLAFARRWKRIDEGLRFQGVKIGDFGKRWLPSVATRETWAAWKLAQREGITDVDEAIARVREVTLLRTMTGVDALRLAFERVGSRDAFDARLWLLGRGITVKEADVKLALDPRDVVDVVASGQPEGLTAPEVAAAWIGKDASAADIERVRRELDGLVTDGRMVADGKGSRGKAVRYRLAGAGA